MLCTQPFQGNNNDIRDFTLFLLQMKLGHVAIDYFRTKFDVDLSKRYANELKELAEEGLLEYDSENIRWHRRGLLCVDNLLFKFFLPKHVTSRLV